jgi:hypothetical protein
MIFVACACLALWMLTISCTTAALWLRQAAHHDKETRQEFHALYEYFLSSGLNYEAIAYIPNVTHAERAALKNDTRTFMEEFYPEVPYRGFTRGENGTQHLPHVEEPQPFYYPAHFVEPVETSLHMLDLDDYVSPQLGGAVKQANAEGKPMLTELLPHVGSNSVAIFHPGIHLSTDPVNSTHYDLSRLTVSIRSLMAYVAAHVSIDEAVSVYLYDSTRLGADAQFLGGAIFPKTKRGSLPDGYHDHTRQLDRVDHDNPAQAPHIPLFPKEEMDLAGGERPQGRQGREGAQRFHRPRGQESAQRGHQCYELCVIRRQQSQPALHCRSPAVSPRRCSYHRSQSTVHQRPSQEHAGYVPRIFESAQD